MSLNLDKASWKRVRLGDVIRHVTDRVDPETSGLERVLAGEHIPSNSLEIKDWGVIGRDPIGPMFYKRFRPGHVLYVSRRSYLRKTAVPDFEGITGEKTFVLETRDSTVLLQEFLPFVLSAEAFHTYAVANSRGSVNPYVNWTDLANYEFDLPLLGEQRRLGDLLWAVESHRRSLDRRVAREAALVGSRLSLWWKSGDKRPIGDIAECVTGSTPSRSNKSYWDSPDVPFYTPTDIVGDTMEPARQKVSTFGAQAGRMLQKNAVAVACIGGDLGKSAVIASAGISNQQITSVVGLDAEDAYLLQALLSHSQGRAAMEARETTTIVRKLNKGDLMKVEVPWPDDRAALRAVVGLHRKAAASTVGEHACLSELQAALLANIFASLR